MIELGFGFGWMGWKGARKKQGIVYVSWMDGWMDGWMDRSILLVLYIIRESFSKIHYALF